MQYLHNQEKHGSEPTFPKSYPRFWTVKALNKHSGLDDRSSIQRKLCIIVKRLGLPHILQSTNVTAALSKITVGSLNSTHLHQQSESNGLHKSRPPPAFPAYFGMHALKLGLTSLNFVLQTSSLLLGLFGSQAERPRLQIARHESLVHRTQTLQERETNELEAEFEMTKINKRLTPMHMSKAST